uniref:Globin family profile domain-containing protein n=1 Tax=Plectus sambesii TaxID=2011161 RepID=A0A914WJZ5_9BILA
MRVAQKREDFADFCETLSGQQWNDMVDKMKEFLDKVIAAVGKDNEIQKLSEQFGEWHVLLRPVGFKPDFFAAAAEAVTKECVHLDQAAHPPTETFLAWAELITLMFSAVRDGYYAEVRRQRKQSSFYGNGKNSLDLSTDGSDEGNGEINSHLSVVNEENVDTTSCNGVEKTRL